MSSNTLNNTTQPAQSHADATTTTTEAVIDATVVDSQPIVHGTQLVRRERRSEVLRPLDADALADSFRQYQELLPRLLEQSDYQRPVTAASSRSPAGGRSRQPSIST